MSSAAPSIDLLPPPAPAQPSWRLAGLALMTLALAAAYFATLGAAPLIEPDEPRYAEIAREMVESGDWLTPHLNYVKYFEKPPLVYWLTALNILVFGPSEWAVRLWPALFGLAGIGVAAWLGHRIYGPPVGLLSAIVLASSPLYFGVSQVLILDLPLTSLSSLAMAAGWVVAQHADRNRIAELVFAACVALAVLTKGPVAVVLAGGSALTFAVVSRRWLWWTRLLSLPSLGLGLALAAPWFVAVSLRNPEFVPFFFVEQHISRYLDPTEHQQPFWFFLLFLFIGFLPWSLVLLVGLRRAYGESVREVSQPSLYLLSWVLFPLVFFSLSGSKLATYILPVFPALAVLFARVLWALVDQNDRPALASAAALFVVLGVGCLGASRLAPLVSTHPRGLAIVPLLLLGGLVLLIGGLVAWRSTSRGVPWRWLAVMAATTLVLEVVVFAGRSVAQHYKPIALAIREAWRPGDRIVLLGHYTQGIPFYTGQRVILVRSWGELDFGSRQGNQRDYFWREEEQLFQAWREPQRMFLVMNRTELPRIAGHLEPPPRELARWERKVVVVNFTDE